MRRAARAGAAVSTSIFISHSSKDKKVARGVAEHLRRQGWQVWIDETGIAGGKAWRAELAQALKRSSVVVVLVTMESMLSKWVVREVEVADDLEKPIIPVVVEDVPYSDSLRIILNRVQRVDAGGPKLEHLSTLDSAVRTQVQRATYSIPGRSQVVTGTVVATVGFLGWIALFPLALLINNINNGENTEWLVWWIPLFLLFVIMSGVGRRIRRAGRKKGI